VLVDGTPQTLPLRDLLRHFVDFRCQVVTRRLEYERLVLQRRLHLLLAERAAVDVIDRVVRIIRNAADDEDSKQQLMATLRYTPHGETRKRPIDEVQAQHIIDMPLKKLNALNQFKLDEEIATKGARIDEINAILASDEGVRDIVRGELREVRKRYAKPRRTVLATQELIGAALSNGNGRAKAVALASAPAEDVWVYVGSTGAVLLAGRGGREPASSPLKLARDASLVGAVASRSDQPLLLFTAQGQAFRAPLSDHQIAKSGPGRPIVAPRTGDDLVGAFAGEAPYYLLVTSRGQIKRLPSATLDAAHPGGIICCRVPDGDRIVAVVPHGEDDEIVIGKANGQVLRLETGSKLRPVATAAAGTVAGVKVDADDRVVSAAVATGEFLLSLHETGRRC
jgi:DNA gyrase subunit A